MRRRVKRRQFISLLGGAAAASSLCPLAARAQQPDRIRRIGVLMLYAENDPAGRARATAFRQQLEKLGWAVGRDLQIDYQWGVGDADWIRSAAAQLLRSSPDVILANGGQALRPVQQATRTIPISSSGPPIRLPKASCETLHIRAATSLVSRSWSRVTGRNCWGC
jgi:putative ABC transport system substrate-binding protein